MRIEAGIAYSLEIVIEYPFEQKQESQSSQTKLWAQKAFMQPLGTWMKTLRQLHPQQLARSAVETQTSLINTEQRLQIAKTAGDEVHGRGTREL